MRHLVLLLSLAGCAAAKPTLDGGERDPLAREIAGRVAGQVQRCVTADPGASLRVVDGARLALRRGDTRYINRLPAACPGLRLDDQLIIEVQQDRFCQNDQFRSIAFGSSIAGPTCRLGAFTPYRPR